MKQKLRDWSAEHRLRDLVVRRNEVSSWRSYRKFGLPELKFGFRNTVDVSTKVLLVSFCSSNANPVVLDQSLPHLFNLKRPKL